MKGVLHLHFAWIIFFGLFSEHILNQETDKGNGVERMKAAISGTCSEHKYLLLHCRKEGESSF